MSSEKEVCFSDIMRYIQFKLQDYQADILDLTFIAVGVIGAFDQRPETTLAMGKGGEVMAGSRIGLAAIMLHANSSALKKIRR
jgi:hypothetical protein